MAEIRTYRWSSDRPADRFPVTDPSTGEVLFIAQGGGPAEVDGAVRSAQAAFNLWRWRTGRERGQLLRACADALRSAVPELVALETRENGKPLPQAEGDVLACISIFDYFAGLTGKLPGDFFDSGLMYGAVMLEPYGVVGAFIPFNWPPIHTACKIAPALAVGNAVVVKPPEQAPSVVMRIIEILQTLLPEDLVQVVPGTGAEAGQALARHPLVRMLTFTGAPSTGSAVLRAAADHHTPALMELGGKNAMIVLADADLDWAARCLIDAAFYNQGEACTAGSRILAHRSVHDALVERLCRAVGGLRVGPGSEPGVHIGPLVTRRQQERVLDYLRIGVEEGAVIAAQGTVPQDPVHAGGFFVAPVVMTGVTRTMRVAREEIFGPVTCVMVFDDDAEAVDIANDTPFGLTAAVFTPDHPRAMRIARQLDVGGVMINNYYRNGAAGMPFGGTKASGYGREHSVETLKEFGRLKLITMASGLGDLPSWPAESQRRALA